METHEFYMHRCIELAKEGLGKVAPNPLVGCVIVHNNKVIGEGYHREYGKAHAEVNAVNSVKDKSLLKQSTLYVNLEPCCHYGKTPPCTDLIIQHEIPHVVIGAVDPYDAVAGKGISKLRNNGVKVDVGMLKPASMHLNRRFFTFHQKKRPYIILKWAQTADAFIDVERLPGNPKRPTWITSEKLRMLVHKWRTEEQSIMVGTITALKDNPKLNVRDWTGRNPTRIVLDENLTLSSSLHLFDNSQKTIVFNQNTNKQQDKTIWIKTDFSHPGFLDNILHELYKMQIQSVIIEGGQKLLTAFIGKNLWDEARIFQGSKFFEKGLRAPTLPLNKFSQIFIGNETLYWVKNPRNQF
ncbi:MAG: bifunctional diaminohydroxyphosphoribosylaminopyrimidine deaminase/5-amino-6-(5-phosphoribosylamino)uracil reductase RibD [Bacteroidetes bacterium]|nr:MAG: bifunctional diaminohydroxyphosphoribosylaminopyrimidine deaminase/5-amino-6-(5-phosphoribosylamino)uracil reductase RibD [Bacteroidota bacterium]